MRNPLIVFSELFIRIIYRKHIKKLINRKQNVVCSFHPTCSEYALLAIKKYGFIKGWIKSIKRIKRCKTYRKSESCIDFP